MLENEQQYREFGIDRTALADILVVTDTGVGVLGRAPLPSVAVATVLFIIIYFC